VRALAREDRPGRLQRADRLDQFNAEDAEGDADAEQFTAESTPQFTAESTAEFTAGTRKAQNGWRTIAGFATEHTD
jgi:hypothetical protein